MVTVFNMGYGVLFPKGTRHEIVRPTGDFAHEKFPEIRYAIDLLVDRETEVLAPSGIVVATKYGSMECIHPKKLAGMGIQQMRELAVETTNYVCIRLPDGTLLEFLHLGTEPFAEEGTLLSESEPIGLIGSSGIMDMPHLHVNRFVVKDGNPISIPIRPTYK